MNDENDIVARDRRIAYHEAGHLTVGRALGAAFGGATINENLDLGYGGLCWGPTYESRFAGEASTGTVVEQMTSLMPGDGEPRDADTALIYQHVHARILELTAGSEAERMHFGEPWDATDDRAQEAALARLIFSCPKAQGMFIAACAMEARAVLERHADLVDALADALMEHRTLDSAQIDDTISRAIAKRQLAQEQERRWVWRETIERAAASANQFEQHRERT